MIEPFLLPDREKIYLLPGKSRVELKDLLCVLCDPLGVPLLLNKF
jgi:hypothetical protein